MWFPGGAKPAAAKKKNKRSVIANRPDEDFSALDAVVIPKPENEKAAITQTLKAHYVFADLSAKLISDIVDVMKPEPVSAGTKIIAQVTDHPLCDTRNPLSFFPFPTLLFGSYPLPAIGP